MSIRGSSCQLIIAVVAAFSVVSCPLEASARTAPCPAQQQAMELLRSRIKSDQDAIKGLSIGITQRELDDAADVAESGRKEAILAAALSLLEGFLHTPEATLETKTIAGYKLKNGLGSIGTGQANVMIGRIRAQGGVKEALIPLLRKLSQISEKTSKLEYLKALSGAASALKSTAELGAGENSLEEAEALFGLAAAIAAPPDLAVSLASAIVNSAKNQTQIYLMAKPIDQLTSTAESQLKDLKVLSAKLQSDVQTLQRFRATDICDTDVSWQIALQQQRLAAAAAGNIDLYDQLLRLHAQIFKQLGVRPCESGFYPGGCNSPVGAKVQSVEGGGKSCPPFSPRNAQDALQVENSSHKDVCWAYNGKTLIATSSSSPDKANKPYPAILQPGNPGTIAAMAVGTPNSTAAKRSESAPTRETGGEDSSIASSAGKIKIQRKRDTYWGGARVYVFFRFPSEQAADEYFKQTGGIGLLMFCEPLEQPCEAMSGNVTPTSESKTLMYNFNVSQLPAGTTGLKLGVCLGSSVNVGPGGEAFPGVVASREQGNFCGLGPAWGRPAYKPYLSYGLPIPKRPYSTYVEIDSSALRK